MINAAGHSTTAVSQAEATAVLQDEATAVSQDEATAVSQDEATAVSQAEATAVSQAEAIRKGSKIRGAGPVLRMTRWLPWHIGAYAFFGRFFSSAVVGEAHRLKRLATA